MKKWLGKRIAVVFDDGLKVQTKHGTLIEFSDNYIAISNEGKEELISFDRIIRVELEEER